jgi:hypothetical protein
MSDATELAIWRGLDAWRVEAAAVELSADGLAASGTQIGSHPVAYRLDATDGFLTRALTVTARGRGWRRELELRHDGHGSWTCKGRAAGDIGLPAPGGAGRRARLRPRALAIDEPDADPPLGPAPSHRRAGAS